MNGTSTPSLTTKSLTGSAKSTAKQRYKDFEAYKRDRKDRPKKELSKIPAKLLKEGSNVRRSFNGRKSMNLTEEDHFKIQSDEFNKTRQKENISSNIQAYNMPKLKNVTKINKNNWTNMPLKEEDRPVNYKTRLKRAQSSKPLRISLKDLE